MTRDREQHSELGEEIVGYLPSLRAFAMSLAYNRATAEDIVQDAVEKALSNIDQFEPGTNLGAWLFTILRNTYYSRMRQSAREVPDVDGTYAEQVSEKPDHDGRLAMDDFLVAFRKLPDEQREVLLLLGFSDLSYDDVANVCACPIGTIKSRASRARQTLADLLGLEDGESMEMTDTAILGVINSSVDN